MATTYKFVLVNGTEINAISTGPQLQLADGSLKAPGEIVEGDLLPYADTYGEVSSIVTGTVG